MAFNARVTSFSMYADESSVLAAMLKTDRLNLVNASWLIDFTGSNAAVWDLFEALYENNIAFIHANGNDFNDGNLCSKMSADCVFRQTDEIARYPFNIQIGSLNSLGVKATYGSGAAIVTALSGYDPADFGDPDEDSPWRTEDNRHYTNRSNGTSAAAASVSGAVALAYQAKPDMTVSQLRYLLAKTSRNDTMMPSLALTPLAGYDDCYGENAIFDCGWQDNAAGFRFANWYGFGVIDAEALVKAALECDKDPVCSGMKELPEKYVSSNINPCAYTDDSRRLITCSFSAFKNEEGESLGRNELILDAVTYDVSGLNYLPEGIIDACELAASGEDEDFTGHNAERQAAVYKANAFLELIAESEAGTKSLLKPLYVNWGYRSGINVPGYEDGHDLFKSRTLEPLDIAASAFYQESLKENPDRKYRLSIRSPCQIDADTLNKNMHLTVYGRRK